MKNYTGAEIAIIGMSGRFPGAKNINAFWENLKNGVDSIQIFQDEDILQEGEDPELLKHPSYVRANACLDDKEYFDADFFGYRPGEARLMDPQTRLFHEQCWKAIEDAGYDVMNNNEKIGLFAGATINSNWENYTLIANQANLVDGFTASYLRNASFLCSTVSYMLNLQGPAVFISTACSTSLVAVQKATMSLLLRECTMALAGGVTISPYSKKGYVYQEGMINSKDGKCRPFDNNASGTVGGEGVGVVVLKRLDDAIKDKDNIYAVIRGSGINNDGHQKMAFTAPSTDGQYKAIVKAINMAGIEPASIGYIESHGTATNLGDPIEVEALNMAFGKSAQKYCALGSVKSNIGHLDAAAGIAGLIKTALALKHRMIPPSLHFENPNTKINFTDSPFYVNTVLQAWPGNSHPLRAGVSSFGIGGTNAHIIMEEAPVVTVSNTGNDFMLFVFSAKTQGALERNIAAFKDHLLKDDGNLADMAYTLQTGRTAMAFRQMIVARDRNDILTQLQHGLSGKKTASVLPKKAPKVIFMFSGQGSQYVNMCRGLYDKEYKFREVVDQCFRLVQQLSGKDLKSVLFADEDLTIKNEIDNTEYTQPLLFIIEYALARLLMHWDIQPDYMIGHSIGEYTAACISGVFSLEEALFLVLRRGELMQQTPGGTMLAVAVTEQELRSLLDKRPDISIAAINSTEFCVVSGEQPAIHAFKAYLDEKGHRNSILRTSHAFHSHMMDPILDSFAQTVRQVRIAPAQIPFISNVTGTYATDNEISRPDYWVQHLRNEVRFSKGIGMLLENEQAVFIEVGPGKSLATFVRSSDARKPEHKVVSLVKGAKEDLDDRFCLLQGIGELWLHGLAPQWKRLYGNEERRRVSLPTYSFEKVAYPVHVNAIKMIMNLVSDQREQKIADVSKWFYVPSWKLSPEIPDTTRVAKNDCILFLRDDSGISDGLIEKFRSGGHHVVCVKAGNGFAQRSHELYEVDPANENDFVQLILSLKTHNCRPDTIIHGWGISEHADRKINDTARCTYLYSLHSIVRLCHMHQLLGETGIVVLSTGLHPVPAHGAIDNSKSLPVALLKVMSQEYPSLATKHIDFDLNDSGHKLISNLYNEINTIEPGKLISWRYHNRWEQIFSPVSIKNKAGAGFRANGVYLITGGLGNIGYAIATHLVKTVNAGVILLGRTKLPSPGEWNSYLGQAEEGDVIKEKITRIQALEHDGGKVIYLDCNTEDLNNVQNAVQVAEQQFGPVNGIIHASGLVSGNTIKEMGELTRGDFQKQFASKINSLQVLDEVFAHRQLDFCLLTSSLSAILGGIRFGAYATANVVMDYYIQAARLEGRLQNWVSVNFDGIDVFQKNTTAINAAELIDVLARLAGYTEFPQVLVSASDLEKRLGKWIYRYNAANTMITEVRNEVVHDVAGELPGVENAISENGKAMLRLWRNFFGKPEITIEDNFFEIGGDSLKALTIISHIHKIFNTGISVRDFFNNPTVKGLSDLIDGPHTPVAGGELPQVYEAIPVAATKGYYPVSSAQKRLYFLYEFDRDSLAYNMPGIFRLKGQIDIERLNKAFSDLVIRHESLRTSFVILNGEPVQRIAAPSQMHITYWVENEAMVPSIVEGFVRPFDLAGAPLIRFGLIKTGEGSYILMTDIHHIVTDGVSFGVLIQEFMSLYNNEQLPALTLQYKDYAVWQQSEAQQVLVSKQREFWINEFSEELPVLQLPVDFERPVIKTNEGASVGFELDAASTLQLASIAEKEGATLFMVVLSVYYIFLNKLSNQDDIVIGTPVAGRNHSELERTVGVFINTLPVRIHPPAGYSFSELLSAVKTRMLACFNNQSWQYEEMIGDLKVERDTSRNPMFDVMFIFQNFEQPAFTLPDVELTPVNYRNNISKLDLTLAAERSAGKLLLNFEFATGLFRTETIERFISYFKQIVSSIIENREVKISDIEFLTAGEKKQLLYDFNDTKTVYPREETLVTLFEKQAARKPDKNAVIYEGNSLTYRLLNRRVNQLAHCLRQKHAVKPGQVVGVMVERSENMIVAILAILKSGAAWLPVDPTYPKERIEYMLQDSQAPVVIVGRTTWNACQYMGEKLFIDEEANYSFPDSDPHPVNNSRDLCYLIYTSGSTGKPKGVMVSHYNVINFFCGMSRNLSLKDDDCMLAITSTSFDISVLELFWTLCNGVQVVIHPSDVPISNLDRYMPGKAQTMDFSLFFFSSYNNSTQHKYNLLLESVKYADRAGFKAVWTPERHFHEFGGLYPNPSVTSAALAMITDRIKLRCGSVVSPLHDEIRIAEEWSVVDNLSGGRVEISFASGWNPNDFVLARGEYKDRQATMYRQIENVRNLWRGKTVKRKNAYGHDVELEIFPRPVQSELPVWVTSAGSEETFKSAGRIGAHILTHFLGQDIETLAGNIRAYRNACREAGHEGKVAIMMHTYIGEDITEVEQLVERPFIEYLKSSIGLSKSVFEEAGFKEDELQDEVKEQLLKNAFRRYYKTSSLIGTKSSCTAMVGKLKEIGVDEIACLVDFGIEESKVLEGLVHLKELAARQSAMGKAHQRVTMMQSTPSFMRLVAEDPASANLLRSLRLLLLGGEAVPLSLVKKIRRINNMQIWNMYGPTETTIWSSMFKFSENTVRSSIGKPIANTRIYILNKSLQPVPVGMAGELFIAGEGVSGGYWNKPELTRERFIADPFYPGEKMYKTGDVAKWLASGDIEFLGRNDHQIKIRGFRIETGEVENHLSSHEKIKTSVVTVKEKKGEKFLVAFYVAEEEIAHATLRNYLLNRLPDYMVPTYFARLDALPMTPNGKLDLKMLPDPVNEEWTGSNYVGPRNEQETALADIWQELLSKEKVGVNDNFFELGGHSLVAIRMISEIKKRMGFELSLRLLFQLPTIEMMAGHIQVNSFNALAETGSIETIKF